MTLVVQHAPASSDSQSLIGTLLKPPVTRPTVVRLPAARPRAVAATAMAASGPSLADTRLAIMIALPYAAGYTMSFLGRAAEGTGWHALAEAAVHDPGLLTALHCLLFALAQPAAAPLIARRGLRSVQLLSLLLSATGAVLLATAPTAPTPMGAAILAGRTLLTLACAGAFAAFAHSVLACVPPRRRAIADCLLVTCGGLCATASGISLGAIATGFDRRSFYVMLAGATSAFAGLVRIIAPRGGAATIES